MPSYSNERREAVVAKLLPPRNLSVAEASAMLYTLVETAKAAGLEPRACLHYLFEILPAVTAPDGIEALLTIGSRPSF
jgi:hypothetical protein